MPMYEFRCPTCGPSLHPEREPVPDCPLCGRTMVRRFGFYLAPPFKEHLSQTTGQYVGTHRDLSEQLKRQSEAATNRLGIEHNFVPIGPGDAAAVGVTDELPHEFLERKYSADTA